VFIFPEIHIDSGDKVSAENKIHQIYSAMQMGQEKFGMQTMNQSLASLYLRRIITYETAMSVTANPEELIDIIQRHEGTVMKKGVSSGAGK